MKDWNMWNRISTAESMELRDMKTCTVMALLKRTKIQTLNELLRVWKAQTEEVLSRSMNERSNQSSNEQVTSASITLLVLLGSRPHATNATSNNQSSIMVYRQTFLMWITLKGRTTYVSRSDFIFYLWTFFAIRHLISETTQRRPVTSTSVVRS